MIAKRGGDVQQFSAKTAIAAQEDVRLMCWAERAQLRADVNEFYVFHGTSPMAAKSIFDNNFKVDLAGTGTGSLYGPGLYFSEASSKSDEYAHAEKDTIFAGQYALLVCRVCCGNINYCDEVNPPVESLVNTIVKDGTHHSVLGDREKCRGTFREFVVFDCAQTYPEYVVIYNRVSQ